MYTLARLQCILYEQNKLKLTDRLLLSSYTVWHWPVRCVLPPTAGRAASIQIGQDVAVIDRLRQDAAPVLIVRSNLHIQSLRRGMCAPAPEQRRRKKYEPRDSSGPWNWTPVVHLKHYLFHREAENKHSAQHYFLEPRLNNTFYAFIK